MKTMAIVQNDAERKMLLGIWNEVKAAKAAGEKFPLEGNHIESMLFAQYKGHTDVFANESGNRGNNSAIVYDLREDGWHIYNFNTMEEEVVGEGDLAGLCNSKEGNFPFFN